jgi:ankyrin repeat protein
MEALIEGRRPTHRRQRHAGSALVHAVIRGDVDAVRSLLADGADPNEPEECNAPHGRALYSAVYERRFDIAKLLLEHGANPNQEVESSADAPSIAIMNSDTRMIELLASYGATWTIPVQLADS